MVYLPCHFFYTYLRLKAHLKNFMLRICMEFSFFNGAVWQLVKQMDWIAIGILLGLFCLSVLCIAIMAFKYTLFRQQRQSLSSLLQNLASITTFNDLIGISKGYTDALGGKLLLGNLTTIKQLSGSTENPIFTSQDLETIDFSGNQLIDQLLLEEETYLPILSICAAVSPLIGLFGTIWGLIHAFVDISQEKSADIATVAPGMAEALIVTLAGLLVAIPALVAFHYFSHELRKFESSLCQVHEKFLTVTKQTFLK